MDMESSPAQDVEDCNYHKLSASGSRDAATAGCRHENPRQLRTKCLHDEISESVRSAVVLLMLGDDERLMAQSPSRMHF